MNLKHLNLLKSLYIFYKTKFTSYVNYWFVKTHVFRVKPFDILKHEVIEKASKKHYIFTF